MAFLEVKDLYKSFGETQVLKGVTIEVNKINEFGDNKTKKSEIEW